MSIPITSDLIPSGIQRVLSLIQRTNKDLLKITWLMPHSSRVEPKPPSFQFRFFILSPVFRVLFLLIMSAHSHLTSELLPWGLNMASRWSFRKRLHLSMTSQTPLFTSYFLASISHSWEQPHLAT